MKRQTAEPRSQRAARRLIWAGTLGLLLGSGPLLACIILAPGSNPIGPGLLFFFSFWPSFGCLAAGLALKIARRARQRERLFGE